MPQNVNPPNNIIGRGINRFRDARATQAVFNFMEGQLCRFAHLEPDTNQTSLAQAVFERGFRTSTHIASTFSNESFAPRRLTRKTRRRRKPRSDYALQDADPPSPPAPLTSGHAPSVKTTATSKISHSVSPGCTFSATTMDPRAGNSSCTKLDSSSTSTPETSSFFPQLA